MGLIVLVNGLPGIFDSNQVVVSFCLKVIVCVKQKIVRWFGTLICSKVLHNYFMWARYSNQNVLQVM